MYLLINSFFPFVPWKRSLSGEPHLIAGIPMLWKRGYHVFSSNDTHILQGQVKRYTRFQGEPNFSPLIRVPHRIDFQFDSEAPTRRTAVLFLTSKILVNRWKDFLAMNFLTIMGGTGDIELLFVNLSGLETIDYSIIALNCRWSTHFPADVHSFLMFSRHLYS